MPDKRLRPIALALLCAMPLLLAFTRAGADAACVIIGVLFLLHSCLAKDWAWLKQPEMKCLLALWLWLIGISWLTPVEPLHAFKSGLIWGRFGLMFAAIRYWLMADKKTFTMISRFGLPVIAFVALDTCWQYKTGVSLTGHPLWGGSRLTGPVSTPNVGNFLLKTGLPILGTGFYVSAGHKGRTIALAGLALFLMGMITLSGERSSTLLMLLGASVVAGVLFLCRPQARLWLLSGGVIVMALAAFLATQPVVKERAAFFAQQMSDFPHSPYGQLYIGSLKLWLSHPITGIGAQQYWPACTAHQGELGVDYCDIHSHNMYIEWLVSSGIIGFALFIAACISLKWQLWKVSRFSGQSAIASAFAFGGIAVLLFPFIVTQSQFANWPAILFWYSLGMSSSLPKLIREDA